jgi:aminoglycoside phosphotransferase (APT) family kinase protein
MYQAVLSPERHGTPRLYAWRWEPERRLYWLFLEDGGDRLLLDFLELPLWTAAARWAARFHAATRALPPAQTDFLPRYDAAHYQDCADRLRRLLPSLPPSQRDLIERGLRCYVTQIERLGALRPSVLHGQFFGKNILLPPGRRAPRVAVIDWETAALGPGTVDLVSLTFGKWTREERHAMQTAYLEQYRAETGERIDDAAFQEELALVALYQSLEWLAWWGCHRELSRHHFPTFLKELGHVLDDHFAAQ